jgi:hypothetical protein
VTGCVCAARHVQRGGVQAGGLADGGRFGVCLLTYSKARNIKTTKQQHMYWFLSSSANPVLTPPPERHLWRQCNKKICAIYFVYKCVFVSHNVWNV